MRDLARQRYDEACARDRSGRWSSGRERDAMHAIGRLALDAADLRGYDRAAAFYVDHLD